LCELGEVSTPDHPGVVSLNLSPNVQNTGFQKRAVNLASLGKQRVLAARAYRRA
jgi:hypothetical protein